MAKIIDDETMENVCILAKLSLSEEEKEKAKAEMQKMLDYVEKLDDKEIVALSNAQAWETETDEYISIANIEYELEAKEGQYQVPKTIG